MSTFLCMLLLAVIAIFDIKFGSPLSIVLMIVMLLIVLNDNPWRSKS